MITLTFATDAAASPCIHLNASRDAVIAKLIAMVNDLHSASPKRAAVDFLRALSGDQAAIWNPALESMPVFSVSEALDYGEPDPVTLIWNSETWREVGYEEEAAA